MSRIWSALILLVCVGVPVGLYFATAPASPPGASVAAASNLCFTAGAVTYQVSPDAAADFRVKIDDARPDLRIALVDGVETADFALVDGVGGFDACESTHRLKTVGIVGERAIGQRLGEMHAGYFLRAVEIGERARRAR